MGKSRKPIWYRARLLLIVTVDDGRRRKRNLHDESVVVFTARSEREAQKRALALGRGEETTYKGGKGHTVRWRLVEVLSIETLGTKIDGVEVAWRLHDRMSGKPIAPDQRYQPGRSLPPVDMFVDGPLNLTGEEVPPRRR